MNPEFMKMASDMMSKLSPEQLAAIQQQAANMSPEQLRQAQNMMNSNNFSGEDIRRAQEAAASMSPSEINAQQTAKEKYEYDASLSLKNEGNKLHSQQNYEQAAEKYERAVQNLVMHTSRASKVLRLSCRSNLASCQLQLSQWQRCIETSSGVLSEDAANRKALYRRGQARSMVGEHVGALVDLQKALQLSPDQERSIIQGKIDEANQRKRQSSQGISIAEIDDIEEVEGVVEDVESIERKSNTEPMQQHMMPALPSGSINPEALKNAAKLMENMSDEQLEAMARAAPGAPSGLKFDKSQMRMAMQMMENMGPDELQKMTEMAKSMQGGSASAAGPPSAMDPSNMPPEMLEEMKKTMAKPETIKMMQGMMKDMDDEALATMFSSAGVKMDAAKARSLADQMGSLSDDQLESMSKMIAKVNTVVETVQKAKKWAISNVVLVVALIALLMAIFLRWMGYA